VTAPNRGLSSDATRIYFEILRDLAEARLRRGDTQGCLDAVARAMSDYRRPPKESRAILLRVRAVANRRLGERDAAIRDLTEARSRAEYPDRERLDAERAFVRSWVLHVRRPSPAPNGVVRAEFRAPDGGELLMQVEGDFLPDGAKLPMRLVDGDWVASHLVPAGAIRYRFVANGDSPRVNATATRVVWERNGAWCLRDVDAP
jgi:hypothetical protein